MFRDLVEKNRSYRRFYQNATIGREILLELVDLARLTASGANRQPIKYFLSYTPEQNQSIFANLAWAGYLPEWPGPVEGERPSAYIVMLLDKRISSSAGCDHGIAAQTILLGAVEKGLGGCMLGAINRPELQKALKLSEDFEILLVIALGKPKESVVIEKVDASGEIKYWRDAEQTHHVPKRSIEEIVL